jgi:glycosyltransferase involved in cell wall biosynthesis
MRAMSAKPLSSSSNRRLAALGTPAVARLLSWLARTLPGSDIPAGAADLVFVTPPTVSQGWILDAICREVGARLPGVRVAYCPFGTQLPLARRYFFSHYMYYIGSISALRPVRLGRSYVFATHLEESKHGVSNRLLARALNGCDGVVCMNSGLRQDLIALGTAADKLAVVVGAADSGVYLPHERQEAGTVGFCSAYYERKSPDLVLDIVRGLPHRRFALLGKGWEKYPRFAEMSALPNFSYVDTSYANYPGHYARMSVFVSASQLEGGPIPLLEAMMSNAVPVASRTGFAPDVIRHGENGFLFDVGTAAEDVCRLIEQAFVLQANVHDTVRHCDWRHFTARLAALMELDAMAGLQPAERAA